jgi:endonuclease YncB( thermonuclease family)
LLGSLGQRQLASLALAAALLAGCDDPSEPSEGRRQARVERVSDGDTISLTGLGKVRLIGVDTPEVFGRPECFGAQASAFTKRVLGTGRRVRFRLGAERRDRYGRALAYVWLADGRFFNELLVRGGYARPLTIPPNDDYARRFAAAARRARRMGRGLWGRPGCGSAGTGRPGTARGTDRDCSDFSTQARAQRYFESRGGGPGHDVDRLDGGDGDGRVCESLP